MPFFPDTNPLDFDIEQWLNTELSVQITLCSRSTTADCPLCKTPAKRVQSRYTRFLSDLPMSGQRVQLQLSVRRFYCDNSQCLRRIFAQRFPILTRPYAQRTDRLGQSLLQIGLVLGGEAGSNLANKLAMPVSPATILRLIKAGTPTLNKVTQSHPPLTKIGIDDWSWKKGVNFGTIIVNLDDHKVVDLLADRSSQTVSKWLRAHPQLEVISRDRATEYALAATQAVPQAIQVADRFHLVRNLAQQVEGMLARLRREWQPQLGLVAQLNSSKIATKPAKTLPHPDTWQVERSNQTQRNHLARREQRMERYKQVVQLREAGLLQREIVERTGLSEKTIRNWLKAEAYPETGPYHKRRSNFDPYAAYVLGRWQEGQHDGEKLWQEIASRGFKGTSRSLRRFLKQLRDEKGQPLQLPQASALESIKARQAVWWFIRQPSKLKESEASKLKLLIEASPSLEEIYHLVQDFMTIVHQLKGDELEGWLQKVKECSYEELHSFARGIDKDKAAVLAGLSLPYSNGVVEGHNHRLKLIKRSMYGRGKLELLKRRVMAQAA